jgi:hypothetical protein
MEFRVKDLMKRMPEIAMRVTGKYQISFKINTTKYLKVEIQLTLFIISYALINLFKILV